MKLSNKSAKKNSKMKSKSKNLSKKARGTKSKVPINDSLDVNSKSSAFPYPELNTSHISSTGEYNSPVQSIPKLMKHSNNKQHTDLDLENLIDKAKYDALQTKIQLDNLSKEKNIEPISFNRTMSPRKLKKDIQEMKFEMENKKDSSMGLFQIEMNSEVDDVSDGEEGEPGQF